MPKKLYDLEEPSSKSTFSRNLGSRLMSMNREFSKDATCLNLTLLLEDRDIADPTTALERLPRF
jgi:hypothetical protein